jgi:hypothetical protein
MAGLGAGMKDEEIRRPAVIRIEGREEIAEKARTAEAIWVEEDTLITGLSSAGMFLKRKFNRILRSGRGSHKCSQDSP